MTDKYTAVSESEVLPEYHLGYARVTLIPDPLVSSLPLFSSSLCSSLRVLVWSRLGHTLLVLQK